MRPALARFALVLALTLVCGACGVQPSLVVQRGAGAGWADPSLRSRHPVDPMWDRGTRLALPGYGLSLPHRPSVACDAFGRCWRRVPAYSGRLDLGYGHRDRPPPASEPPGWAGALPDHAREPGRFIRPRRDVVCDRATRICYRRGRVDASTTADVFGRRAGDRADDVRDQRGTAWLFVPERGVACDRGRRLCFEDGDPDRDLTRRYFDRRAADVLNPSAPAGPRAGVGRGGSGRTGAVERERAARGSEIVRPRRERAAEVERPRRSRGGT